MKNTKKILHKILLTDVASDGKCVGKTKEGFVVFVRNAAPGDLVDVEVQKRKKRFYEGLVLHFHQFSQERTKAQCTHFGLCGGCTWQHIKYQAQLFFKQKQVQSHFERIAGVDSPEVLPVLPAQNQYAYRNKMEFSFSCNRWLTQDEIESGININDKRALGFHINGRWDKVLDLEECHLHTRVSEEIRMAVKDYAMKSKWSFYDLKQKKGFLRTLMIRNTYAGELMVLVQFFNEDKKKREDLLSFLKRKFPHINSLLYVINDKLNDAMYHVDPQCFYGRTFIYETIGHLRFMIDAKSFFQTHSKQALQLFEIVRNFASFSGDEIVYDLYTGLGAIAQFIARDVQRVIGIETVPEAIERARENARLNSIENCGFFCANIKDIFNLEFVSQYGKPDVVITDPPRDGMHKRVIEQILKIAPRRIVYVSCKSATQARDVALMKEIYKIVKIQPVDMFPQTHHVENVVLLEKKS